MKERRISSRHWRCARCLFRVRVDEHGWVCGKCGVECEKARVDIREDLRRKEEKSGKKSKGSPSGSTGSAGKGASSSGSHSGSTNHHQEMQWSYPNSCAACHGSGWVNDARSGGLLACISCQQPPLPSYNYDNTGWSSSAYPPSSQYYP